ncbi:hypothetical protein GCM10010149_39860 [Nonomuraea roseoviolacea subsp. roseoviolacea]|uniref:DUF4328 domain-containing protein n=1 Tax=Nonomuraea roseoviolacea subsp. carminata TaxID=160689 RepID=A0ABT1JXB3_9ACTN|nr:DUF4328 domain-containing protein [Nonomuraea roseoviolacea]MCP2345409.1 hypothetical protein [Nonomuraea roseoviolacea subsp. carminata]
MYPASPSGPSPMYFPPPPVPVRPIRGLGTAVLVLLAADALVEVVAGLIGLGYLDLLDRLIADPQAVEDAEIDRGDLLYSLSGLAEFATMVTCGIVFLVWLFRARANAEALAPWPHRRAKPWLVFGWFVPIVGWWFPKQIVDDIWNASKPGAAEQPLTVASRSGLVRGWWAAWLVSSWISHVAARLLFKDDLESLRAGARFDLVSIGLWIVTAGLAAAVVWRITRLQEERLRAPAAHPYLAS